VAGGGCTDGDAGGAVRIPFSFGPINRSSVCRSSLKLFGPLKKFFGPDIEFSLYFAPLLTRTRKSAEKIRFRRDLRLC
jgi:hypothetical protein